MDELDNVDYYNGEPVHDMEVDYDYHINTGYLLTSSENPTSILSSITLTTWTNHV